MAPLIKYILLLTLIQQSLGNSTNGKPRRSPSPSSSGPSTTFPSHDELKTLSRNITAILDAFSANYDKRVRPNYGGEPVSVGVTMYVLSISSISEVLMDFTLDFYFRQMWSDNRLSFTGPVKTLSVGSEFLSTMWVPDTFFVNEKTSYFHTATTSNEFLRISDNGDILRSIRLTVTASCPMDLRHFPMDSQLCNIEIESFGYTMSDIRYKWAKGAGSVGVSNDVSLPQFKVMGYRQKAFEISLSTGNYSRLACEIQFVRSMGYYLIQIYIPSSLIVVISWVSFWLNRNAAPARVYLGITTVLTMTTLMSSTNKALPKISYVKSIDVFLGTCFVMVFAALLEYATVGYLAKRIQMRKNHFAALQKMANSLQNAHQLFPQQPQPSTSFNQRKFIGTEKIRQIIPINPNQICGITPSDIDKYSRVVFPVCFVCFNTLYWIIYLHISNVVVDDLVLLGQN
ncbi:gamma-aminobutyric acid receptor subunit beta isoform X1 [Folsomia candida]|uniref:gamma-aminobutyric acid receptor subunit beta isoform X1 n=2 Tax=Folsomia candida TaxID=158441 RepID=UPI000B9025BD|nr:gamma-aminobutyric acid receptor subunit beta isoform X1 [Folsomia candida]